MESTIVLVSIMPQQGIDSAITTALRVSLHGGKVRAPDNKTKPQVSQAARRANANCVSFPVQFREHSRGASTGDLQFVLQVYGLKFSHGGTRTALGRLRYVILSVPVFPLSSSHT